MKGLYGKIISEFITLANVHKMRDNESASAK